MTKILILGANGQIAQIVTQRLLDETDAQLTLFLRRANRLQDLAGNDRVTLVDGDVHKPEDVTKAMEGQDLVFASMVDHDDDNATSKNVIAAMKKSGTSRVISANVLGIYDEVPGKFGRWNKEMIGPRGLSTARESDRLYAESGLDYTTLRLPWLNDRDEIDYTITHKDEEYVGVSGSRQSMADVVVQIVKNPDFLTKDSVGIANPSTQGENRPVY